MASPAIGKPLTLMAATIHTARGEGQHRAKVSLDPIKPAIASHAVMGGRHKEEDNYCTGQAGSKLLYPNENLYN